MCLVVKVTTKVQVVLYGNTFKRFRNHMGWINQNLKLSDREWTCTSCGVIHDRDVNASINILKEGLKNISAGTVDYTSGAKIRLLTSSEAVSISYETRSQFAFRQGVVHIL